MIFAKQDKLYGEAIRCWYNFHRLELKAPSNVLYQLCHRYYLHNLRETLKFRLSLDSENTSKVQGFVSRVNAELPICITYYI